MLSRREMYYGVGYRPHTVQRIALGASRDGRLTAIVHDAYQETSTYEEYSESLVNATRFLQMVSEIGSFEAARRLLAAPAVSDGFTALWERGRLD